MSSMGSTTTTVRGTPIRWEEHGEGSPVVLVHGIPTSPALWRHVAPLVEGQSLAWEMVGYGQSIPAGRDRDISVNRQADYLLAWLDELGIERAVFAGHDLGGGVVQIAAVRAPERCAALMLTNSVGYDSWPIPSIKAMGAVGGLVERLPDSVFRLALASLIWRGHDDARCARESLALHWANYAEYGGAAAMMRQVRSLDVGDTIAVQDDLRRLRVPSRVVWGAADQFQKVRYGDRFAGDLGTDLRRIEGGKHWTPEDHAPEVAAAINELVRETRRA